MTINNTPCKDCCFAIYDDITQVGCARNRIEKYKDNGAEIIEAYDEEKEFFVIKDRLCPFFRSKKWLDAFSEKSDEDMEKILAFETMSSFHLIILLKEGSIEDLKDTIDSVPLEFKNVPPTQITIIRPRGSKVRPQDIKDLFTGVLVRWRIENLLVNRKDSEVIHSAQKIINTQYYCVCNAGYKFPKDYFKSIHKAVIDNLLQFGLIEVEKDQLDGIVIPRHVHEYWYFHGDIEKTIPENVKDYQCQNPDQEIVFQFKKINPQSV